MNAIGGALTNTTTVVLNGGGLASISDFEAGTTTLRDSVKVTVLSTTVYISQNAVVPRASRLELLHSGRVAIDRLIEALNLEGSVPDETPSASSN